MQKARTRNRGLGRVGAATHYNYFRNYDPTTGRYVESDPIGIVGGINAEVAVPAPRCRPPQLDAFIYQVSM